MKGIEQYHPSPQIKGFLKDIERVLSQGDTHEVEQTIACVALTICDNVIAGSLDRGIADEFFTLLDVYVTDNHPGTQFSEAISDLVMEGMLFHHYGEEYGPDCSKKMKLIAQEILETAPVTQQK